MLGSHNLGNRIIALRIPLHLIGSGRNDVDNGISRRFIGRIVMVKGYLKLSFPRRRESITLANNGFLPPQE